MDYIREELLRQRAALAKLLLGSTEEEKSQKERSGTEGWPVPEMAAKVPGADSEAAYRSGWRDWERQNGADSRSFGPMETVRRRAAEAGTALWEYALPDIVPGLEEVAALLSEYGGWQADGGGTGRTSWPEEWNRAAADQAWAAGGNRFGNRAAEIGEADGMVFGTDSAVFAGERGPGVLRRTADGRTAAERSVVELVRPAAGEPSDPRVLSRAFQRDARRYDGGFTLY